MIEIIFKYKNQYFKIEYNEPRKLKEIFEEFADSHSLEKDKTFLIYNGQQVNLNTDMFVEEQFNLLKKKNKKRLVFLVCEETPFQMIFISPQKKVILKVELTEKMKDVLERLSLKAGINLENILYNYSAKVFTYKEFKNKTVNDVITPLDRKEKLMSISIEYRRSKTIDSIDKSELSEDILTINHDLDDDSDESYIMDDSDKLGLLEGAEKNKIPKAIKVLKFPKKKNFYIKNLLILLIQYIIILALTIVGFENKINEKLIEVDIISSIKYIPFCVLIFSLNLLIVYLSKFKTSGIMIIFHVFYPPFIIYYSLLFSSFIDSKYIIIGLSLVGIELFSLLFNILFELFELKFFVITSLLFSLLGLIIFSVFWIKDIFSILYVSIFWLISNGYYIFWILLITKKRKFNQYYYSSLIFSYGIFLGIASSVKYCINEIKNYIVERIDDNSEELEQKKKFFLYNFIILFIQYTIIITLTIVGFEYKINEILLEVDVSLLVKYFPVIVFVFLLSIIIACLSKYKKSTTMIIFHVFYPPFIIYYSFLFSSFIDSKYIIIGLSLIGIEVCSLLFNALLKNFRIIHFCLYSSLFSLIGLIFFSAFWIKSWIPILCVSIFWIVSNAIYIIIILAINKYCEFNEFFYSSLIFDYNILLALAFIIKYCFSSIVNYIISRIDDNSDETQKKKYFYLRNFIILIIQYVIIITSTILGFEYEVNKMLINSEASLEVKFIPFITFIFVSCLVIYCSFGCKTNKWLIIFHIFYPPFIIYYSLLLSSFIDSKYIIIGLSLVGIELFSLLFNIFLKKFEIIHFCLYSSLFSLIGLILFSVFWLKAWLSILFISIFWVISDVIYIIIIIVINEFCELNEFFYSSLIFDYNIILAIISVIYIISEYFSSRCKKVEINDESENRLKTYGTLLLQYLIITIFVWIGFFLGWNDGVRDNFTAIGVLVGICTVVNVIMSIRYLIYFEEPDYERGCEIFSIIFYVPLMIIYFYGFSASIENKYILSFVFILFFDILSMFLSVYFCDPHYKAVLGSCFISNIIAIILFHFFWLNNVKALIWLIVLSFFTDIYFAIMAYITQSKYRNIIMFPVTSFNYGFFGSILYILHLFCKCTKQCCKEECDCDCDC